MTMDQILPSGAQPFDEWSSELSTSEAAKQSTNTLYGGAIPDFLMFSYINTKHPVSAIMRTPIDAFDGKFYTAKSMKVYDIDEFLSYVGGDAGHLLLYTILYMPNVPEYGVYDDAFNYVPHDKVKISDNGGFWIIRFALERDAIDINAEMS